MAKRVKKKSVKKRYSEKSSPKRSSKVSRKSVKSKKQNSQKVYVTERKIRKTTMSLIYSGIVFILSLILFLVTTDFLESLFGFTMIISGALVLLFIILEIIFYFMKRK